jgi:hypothetical protein
MRKSLIALFAVTLLVGFAFGEIEVQRYKADFTTATQASNQVSTVVNAKGFLQQIDIIPSGTYTASVTITYTPLEGSAINIYTNTALTAQTVLRPAVDKTDVTGAALTSDDPTRYLVQGGTLTVTSTNVNKAAGTSLVVMIGTEK